MLKIIHIFIQWKCILKNKLMMKTLNLKLAIMSEFLNKKIFFLKDIHQIGLKTFLQLKKVKNTVPWTYVINDLNGKEIIGTF